MPSTNLDKYAAIFGAGKRRASPPKKKVSATQAEADTSLDDEIAPGTPMFTTVREHQIKAKKDEDRHWKRYCAIRTARLDRLTSEVPAAAKFLRTLDRAAPSIRAVAYRDVDVDIAGLARRYRVADIAGAVDRLAIYEVALALVERVTKRAGFAEPDPATYFTVTEPTALDELKEELGLG